MLECKPDKLAQNAPSQSEAQKARQAIPVMHITRQAIPDFKGRIPQIKGEVTEPQGNSSKRDNGSNGNRGEQ